MNIGFIRLVCLISDFQKEDRIKELNKRLQQKAQQRAKLAANSAQGVITKTTAAINNTGQSMASKEPSVATNSIPAKTVDFVKTAPSSEPSVGTLVTISTNPLANNEVIVNQVNILPPEGAISNTNITASTIGVDPNSDSALPTSSATTKSSKTSGSEEVYSESYC